MNDRCKRAGFGVVLSVMLVAAVELALHGLALLSPAVRDLLASPWGLSGVSLAIPDERLEHRPNPALPDHDANGFRNYETAKLAIQDARACLPISTLQARTVLTLDYRRAALDPGDPRIGAGKRIALEAIRRLHERAASAGVRLVVLLVPTKELVFGVLAGPELAPGHAQLVALESEFRNEVAAFLDRHGIESLDLLPALRAQLERGPQPYRGSADGHPNEVGHRVIARTIARYLDGAGGPRTDHTERPS